LERAINANLLRVERCLSYNVHESRRGLNPPAIERLKAAMERGLRL
jgi:hypothetical protein